MYLHSRLPLLYLQQLIRRWKGATIEARVDYICQARAHDAIKDQPEIITGKDIVMPSAPYFPKAAASLAGEARSEATYARKVEAVAKIARVARKFLVKIQASSAAASDSEEAAPLDPASSNKQGGSESKRDGDDHTTKDAGDNKRSLDDASSDVGSEDTAAGEPTDQKVREKVFHEGRRGRLRVGSSSTNAGRRVV